VFLSASIGPTYLGSALINLTRFKHSNMRLYLGVFGLVNGALMVCVLVLGIVYINAHSYWYWYQGPSPKINVLNQLMASVLVCIYTPFIIAISLSMVLSIKEITERQENEDGIIYEPPDVGPLQPRIHLRGNLRVLGLIVFSFLVFFVLTLFLPPNWAQTSMSLMSANSYFAVNSPWSVIQNYVLYQRDVEHFILLNASSGSLIDDYYGCNASVGNSAANGYIEYTDLKNSGNWFFLAELADATDGTASVVTSDSGLDDGLISVPSCAWLQPTVYMKLYTDVIVYYSFIFGIITVAILSTYWIRLRRSFHRRFKISLDTTSNNFFYNNVVTRRIVYVITENRACNFRLGMSVGEAVLIVTVTSLHCYWFWFWSVGWGYRDQTISPGSLNYPNLQRYSRAFGELAVLTMSFLLFPVTHNSMWESVFGVPFTR
jgi:hypothetical protein